MSVNIGTNAVLAAQNLRGNPDFERLVDELGQVAQMFMVNAQKSEVAVRVDQTAYARGMYDLWASLFAALKELKPNQVKPPPPPRANRVSGSAGTNYTTGDALNV